MDKNVNAENKPELSESGLTNFESAEFDHGKV